eukprot:TRINITY_DN22185_c1_g1_i1.p1 TRINITY_DN22185_c1_g1~~TRINITY_DN22185_c1_g1_i1.p1  ORF type:complete len:103 (-),score=12.18 TRINITY_DN22185_c1_g1_i1:187-495(-)
MGQKPLKVGSTWDIIKKDILDFLREFHERGILSNNMGASFIDLIPKKPGADSAKDFRPISLLGSIYKILEKVLTGRLKRVMPSIILILRLLLFTGGRSWMGS